MSAKALDSVIRRWPTERAKAWLASFLERARRDENVVAIVAIGSAVRSTAAEDLDILVLCRNRVALKEKAPIEVDVRKANAKQSRAISGAGTRWWPGQSSSDAHCWTNGMCGKVWSNAGETVSRSLARTSRWRERRPSADA